MRYFAELVGNLRYDNCLLTGDFRGKAFGPFDATLDGVARVRARLREPLYMALS